MTSLKTDRLPSVTDAQRAAILSAPRTSEAHRALMADVDAMAMLEVGGDGAAETLPAHCSTVAWNLERCLFPRASAAHMSHLKPQVILLSEMDSGMARTGQRNTTAEMASALGMHYAYGVEFFEMGLGGETELRFCSDDVNAEGWHGNAILSAAPFDDLLLIRLDDHGHWFTATAEGVYADQPRIGGRMAIAAVITTEAGPVCFVSTHLESAADAAYRSDQMVHLLDAVDGFAPGLPVVIAGDLNTGNQPPGFDWRTETLFEAARQRGYHWDANAEGTTTRPSLITLDPKAAMKLDWFALRGCTGKDSLILPSTQSDGPPLSDHDVVATMIEVG